MSNWVVLKFGGTSVSNLERWQNIESIIECRLAEGMKVLVVHSAAQGMTNLLEKHCQEKHDITAAFTEKADKLAKELGVNQSTYAQTLSRLGELCQITNKNTHQKAELMAMGEYLTHQIVLAYLQANHAAHSVDPKAWLISTTNDQRSRDSQVLSAKCEANAIPKLQQNLSENLYVMPGFFVSDQEGNTVLLGRGGSDTSAAYMAAALEAERLEIWTDVHGIFSANPHTIPNARLLHHLGYVEAREIAASGGKVLHPRCILPVEQHQIPLHIKNTQAPDAQGTVLATKHAASRPRVSAINTRHQITLVSMESINMWHQAGFMGDVFGIYKELGLSIDLVSTAQTNVTISLDHIDNVIQPEILQELAKRLRPMCDVQITRNCSAVTLVGYRIRALADQIAPVIATFADQRIHITTQSSNDLNQTFVVDEDQADKLTRALHEVLITDAVNTDHLGPSWAELMTADEPAPETTSAWWHTHANRLLEMAQSGPSYVYHLPTISHQIQRLQSLQAVDRVFYACKANTHPDVIKHIHDLNVSLETVSPGEISRVQNTITGIRPEEILFTANFAPVQEYQDALLAGLHVTIDNAMILKHWPDVFANQEVILRLDPGHGSGHHRYVRTAGEQSKFGIPADELSEVAGFCRQHNITVKGLHAHSGSGILDHKNWTRIAEYLGQTMPLFPEVRILNIGGGLGIKESPGDPGLDFQALDASLLTFKQQHPNIELWIEPGRFLVAHSGVLIASVTQTKWKGKQGYIGIDTGMNSLIRPALYGAWHNIVNLSKLDQPNLYTANVVGPMCETGDVLGIDRPVPKTEVGDVMLIANAGAYGAVMSSRYNLREPAAEQIVTAP